MSSWLDEVKTSMYTVVNNFHTVNAIFLFQIRIKPRLDILNNGLPAAIVKNIGIPPEGQKLNKTHLSSLLTKSPKPGVSTTVK